MYTIYVQYSINSMKLVLIIVNISWCLGRMRRGSWLLLSAVAALLVGAGGSPQDQGLGGGGLRSGGGGGRSRHEPKYERVFQPGMNCNFEVAGACSWSLVPANTTKTVGNLTYIKGLSHKNYIRWVLLYINQKLFLSRSCRP